MDPTSTKRNEMSVTFGQVIKIARESKGISFREMGKRMGVQHVVIFEMETGKRMPFGDVERLQKLADELELDIETLTVKSIQGRNLMPLLKLAGKRLVSELESNE